MRWRLYYGDGTTLSDRDTDAFHARPTNVQVLAVEDAASPTGFVLWHGKDAYYWREDIGWTGCDTAGMWDYLMLFCGPKVVLFGRSLRDDEFWKIVDRAGKEGLG